MACAWFQGGIWVPLFLLFPLVFGISHASIPVESVSPRSPKAISDLREAILKALGFQSEDLKISGFDVQDAVVGHSIAYKFYIEVGKKEYPFMFLEDVKQWDHVDLPIFHMDASSDRNGLARRGDALDERMSPVLAPFQLQGPMELWIQDGDDVRVSIPHDVDAGILKKVLLADGATVTVKGAKSASLLHPVDLPLPLNHSRHSNSFFSAIASLTDHLRLRSLSQQKPILSVRIVGPSALASPSSSLSKLKLKRLAPGLVELSKVQTLPAVVEEVGETALIPDDPSTFWPLASVNGTNPKLLGFEKVLYSVLGEKAEKPGSFRLAKAEVSAQVSVKMTFSVEREIKKGEMDWSQFPGWKTRPRTVRMHFEVIGKVDGNKLVPDRVVEVPDPVQSEDTFAHGLLMGNMTMSSLPLVQPPPSYFTL